MRFEEHSFWNAAKIVKDPFVYGRMSGWPAGWKRAFDYDSYFFATVILPVIQAVYLCSLILLAKYKFKILQLLIVHFSRNRRTRTHTMDNTCTRSQTDAISSVQLFQNDVLSIQLHRLTNVIAFNCCKICNSSQPLFDVKMSHRYNMGAERKSPCCPCSSDFYCFIYIRLTFLPS